MKSKELLGGYIYKTEEKITDVALSNSSAKILPAHSVLIAMYGASVGAFAIISHQMACNQAICVLIENNEYPYTYLYQVVCEASAFLKNLAVGSAQQNISQVVIKKLLLHGDVNEISRFHSFALPIHEKMEALYTENNILVEIRDGLLPRLMSGELDVSSLDI